jgi:hypothetical protein
MILGLILVSINNNFTLPDPEETIIKEELITKDKLIDISLKRQQNLFYIAFLSIINIIMVNKIIPMFIVSEYMDFWAVSFWVVLVDPVLFAVGDMLDDGLLFLQFYVINNMTCHCLIMKCNNISSMILTYMLYTIIKHIKMINSEKFLKYLRMAMEYTISRPSEDEKTLNDTRQEIQRDQGDLFEDMYSMRLNANIKSLGLLTSDLISILSLIPTVFVMLADYIYIRQETENKVNYQAYLMLVVANVLLDSFNYLLFIQSSKNRDGK